MKYPAGSTDAAAHSAIHSIHVSHISAPANATQPAPTQSTLLMEQPVTRGDPSHVRVGIVRTWVVEVNGRNPTSSPAAALRAGAFYPWRTPSCSALRLASLADTDSIMGPARASAGRQAYGRCARETTAMSGRLYAAAGWVYSPLVHVAFVLLPGYQSGHRTGASPFLARKADPRGTRRRYNTTQGTCCHKPLAPAADPLQWECSMQAVAQLPLRSRHCELLKTPHAESLVMQQYAIQTSWIRVLRKSNK